MNVHIKRGCDLNCIIMWLLYNFWKVYFLLCHKYINWSSIHIYIYIRANANMSEIFMSLGGNKHCSPALTASLIFCQALAAILADKAKAWFGNRFKKRLGMMVLIIIRIASTKQLWTYLSYWFSSCCWPHNVALSTTGLSLHMCSNFSINISVDTSSAAQFWAGFLVNNI